MKLRKNRTRPYGDTLGTKATVYAYETAQQDATNTSGINNLPSSEEQRRREEEERIARIHAEARRQINISTSGAASIAAATTRNSRVTAATGLVAFINGVESHCLNCHK